MSAFTFRHTRHRVEIEAPEGLSQAQVEDFPAFNNWLDRLVKSLELQTKDTSHPFFQDPYQLRRIIVQSYDIFKSSEVGFLKVRSDVANSNGSTLPGIVFLRGASVAVLVILTPEDAEDQDEKYVILTIQPRIAAGSLGFVELPAGMVDHAGNFSGAAAKEIEEETGLVIPESELVNLSKMAAESRRDLDGEGEGKEELPLAMYPSAGGCDEYVEIFMHEKKLARGDLEKMNGKLTGLRDEGENITLKLVRMQDLWREGLRDAKTLSAIALYEGLKREGKI